MSKDERILELERKVYQYENQSFIIFSKTDIFDMFVKVVEREPTKREIVSIVDTLIKRADIGAGVDWMFLEELIESIYG